MKTLEAKPFDQNAENWKRENRLFTSTVLAAGASGGGGGGESNWYVRTQKSSNSLIRFRCSNSCFLLETDIAGHERLFLAKWHPKAEEKLRRRPFFDIADRHEKLYGRSRLYARAQGRHETGGILSLFSSLSFEISMKNSVQRWSSDFQDLFPVKIRKMALGSNDLSTLPLSSNAQTSPAHSEYFHLTSRSVYFNACMLRLFQLLVTHFVFFHFPGTRTDRQLFTWQLATAEQRSHIFYWTSPEWTWWVIVTAVESFFDFDVLHPMINLNKIDGFLLAEKRRQGRKIGSPAVRGKEG